MSCRVRVGQRRSRARRAGPARPARSSPRTRTTTRSRRATPPTRTRRPAASSIRSNAGYGAFSVSPSHKEDVYRYIADQREHHRKVTFQEEYRKLLMKYGVGFDERYVWD